VPLQIGNKFVVVRSTENIEAWEQLSIILAHGHAFGSGEHETTRSCLEELEKLPVAQNMHVLDIGCGTGVLAIAAAKMGVGRVIALDTSWSAISTASAGIQLNKLGHIIKAIQGDIRALRGRYFDLIMANLYGDILLQIATDINARLKDESYLMLSGISYEFTYDIKAAFIREGCRLITSRYMDEYTTLVFQK
jgi:ribosomal protein L11 methyltransferase